MRREYFERMTDIGTASAAARWIADLLPPWLTWLREPEMKPQDLDDEVQLMLVTGFNISLAVRDAIIMTVVADESQWTKASSHGSPRIPMTKMWHNLCPPCLPRPSRNPNRTNGGACGSSNCFTRCRASSRRMHQAIAGGEGLS